MFLRIRNFVGDLFKNHGMFFVAMLVAYIIADVVTFPKMEDFTIPFVGMVGVITIIFFIYAIRMVSYDKNYRLAYDFIVKSNKVNKEISDVITRGVFSHNIFLMMFCILTTIGIFNNMFYFIIPKVYTYYAFDLFIVLTMFSGIQSNTYFNVFNSILNEDFLKILKK